MARVRLVAEEVPGGAGRLEPAAEALVLGGDRGDAALPRARHFPPRALGVRGGAPVAPAEPDRARQLARDERHLLAGARGALGIVELLGLLDLVPEVLEARAVLALGLRVEQRAGVAVARAARLDVAVARGARPRARGGGGGAFGGADDVDRVELDARVGEQERQVAQALGVLDEPRAALVLDPPDVALAAQERGRRRAARRSRRRRGRERLGRNAVAGRPDHRLDPLDLVADLRHTERGRALARTGEQARRRLGVARSGAAGQDPRLVEVEQRERRPERQPLRRLPRSRHVRPRGVPVLAGGGAQREVARHRAAEDALRRDHVAGVERLEQLLDRRRALAVVQPLAQLGEQRHPHHPDVVAREVLEAAAGEVLELAPRVQLAAVVEVEHGQRAPPRRHRGQAVGELADGALELAKPPLRATQREQLRAGEDRDGRVLQAPRELHALVDQSLGLLGAALHERTARAVQRDVRARAGIADVGRDAVERRDRHVGGRQVVELEQQVDVPDPRADHRLVVADDLRQREQLVRPGELALERVGPGRRDPALVEDEREGRGVPEAPRDRDGLRHERLAPVGLVAPVDRDGEADEQPRAQRAVGRVDGRERLLEHRDELVVDDAGGEAEAAEAQGRPAEEVRVAEAAAELEGLEQARAGRVLAGVHLRLAAREHQLAATLLVGLAGEVERPQRGVEEVGGLLVGERAQRLVARPFGVVQRAALVAGRRRLDEVVGELEQPGAARSGPGALERLADRAVQPRAADGAQIVVERLADQSVGEAEGAGLARRLVEQVQGERLVEALEQLGPPDAGGALERGDAEPAAGDGGDLERLARRRAQRLEAAADRVAHAVGQRQPRPRLDVAVGDEQADDLVAEERVALGDRGQAADEVVGRLLAAAVDDQPPQVVGPEAADLDAPAEAAELAEDALHLGAATRPRVVVRRDDEDRAVADRAGEEGEQQERRQVGGVEVVEQHDQRRVAGDPAQEDRDRVEQGEARLLRLRRVAGRRRADALADLGRELRDPAGPGAQVLGEARVVALGRERADDLQPVPVRRCAAAFPATGERDLGAGLARVVAERARQARLADAGLAVNQHEAAAACARVLEGGRQLRQLARAPEQRKLAARGDGIRAVHLESPHGP